MTRVAVFQEFRDAGPPRLARPAGDDELQRPYFPSSGLLGTQGADVGISLERSGTVLTREKGSLAQRPDPHRFEVSSLRVGLGIVMSLTQDPEYGNEESRPALLVRTNASIDVVRTGQSVDVVAQFVPLATLRVVRAPETAINPILGIERVAQEVGTPVGDAAVTSRPRGGPFRGPRPCAGRPP